MSALRGAVDVVKEPIKAEDNVKTVNNGMLQVSLPESVEKENLAANEREQYESYHIRSNNDALYHDDGYYNGAYYGEFRPIQHMMHSC